MNFQAIQRLQECRLKDEEEENVQKKLLLRTLLNIGLCYMKVYGYMFVPSNLGSHL